MGNNHGFDTDNPARRDPAGWKRTLLRGLRTICRLSEPFEQEGPQQEAAEWLRARMRWPVVLVGRAGVGADASSASWVLVGVIASGVASERVVIGVAGGDR